MCVMLLLCYWLGLPFLSINFLFGRWAVFMLIDFEKAFVYCLCLLCRYVCVLDDMPRMLFPLWWLTLFSSWVKGCLWVAFSYGVWHCVKCSFGFEITALCLFLCFFLVNADLWSWFLYLNMLKVPVGRATLGRIINVIGEPIDERGDISKESKTFCYLYNLLCGILM